MAVECRAGSFNVSTGTVGTTQDIIPSDPLVISGQSAVILFFNGRQEGAVDVAGRQTRWRGLGFAVSNTDRRCQVSQDQDAAAAHIGGSYHSNAACIASNTISTTTDGLMDFDSWLSNGFRLIVDDQMPRAYRVGYLIITGLDNAATGQWQDQTVTGSFVVTSALSFQPDCEVMMATLIDTNPPGGRAGNEMLGIGFAVSTSQQATWTGGSDEGSATTDTDSYSNDIDALAGLQVAAGTLLHTRWGFLSHNSNGFSLTQRLINATITWNHFLALKGGSYSVQSVATRTDSNDINTGALGFTPAGLLMLSAYKAEHAAGTPTVNDTFSMGVANSATSRFAAATWSVNGVADTVVYTAIEHDEVYIGISSTPAVEGLMDIKTWADPITFVMDDTDPSAKFATMLVIGNAAGGAATRKFQKALVAGV